SEEEILALGFTHALLVNDFAALAFAAGHIPANELKTIGPELAGLAGEPVSILGAGTGFGVSALARWKGRAAPLATEGGHIGFAPSNARERALLDVLAARFPRVSIERLLSGPGILNIYSGLGEIEGKPAQAADAAEVQRRADAGDRLAEESLALFLSVFGAVAGDIALAHGARGGVYIAGGIAQKLEARLSKSRFRECFEDKGRLASYVKPIPTRLILSEDAAFIGAAHASLEARGTQ
ncbi:MAG: glucokinase, partial [Alphaproteobacteria bacterium]|nr:glucokinase [Alphaproteobacteria bacterium]